MIGVGTKRSSSSSSNNNNGLVVLYEAAMLLEQREVRLRATAAGLPPASAVNRPLTFRVAPLDLAGGQGQHHQQQQLHPSCTTTTTTVQAALQEGFPLAVARRPSPVNRSSHNELEKTRRARLRLSMDTLRDELPLTQGEASRMTMLNVLKRACMHLKELESLSTEQRTRLRQVERRRVELQMRRAHLMRVWRHLRKRAAASAAAAAAAATAAATNAAPVPAVAAAAAAVAGTADGSGSGSAGNTRAAHSADASSSSWRLRNASDISVASASSEEAELIQQLHHQQQHQNRLRSQSRQQQQQQRPPAANQGSQQKSHSHHQHHSTTTTTVAKGAAAAVAGTAGKCGSPDSGYVSPPNLGGSTAAS